MKIGHKFIDNKLRYVAVIEPQIKKVKARNETNLRWKYFRLKKEMNRALTGTAQTNACQSGVVCLISEMTKTTTAKTQTNETARAVILILLETLNSEESSLTKEALST